MAKAVKKVVKKFADGGVVGKPFSDQSAPKLTPKEQAANKAAAAKQAKPVRK